jgi:hypothetical protein
MNIVRAAFAVKIGTCLSVLLPGTAAAFSAQDVLTYCQATHADTGFVRDKLRAAGWQDVGPAEAELAGTSLRLAMLATWNFSTRESYSPSDWQADWATAQANVSRYTAKLDEDSSVLLIEPKTSSVILVSWIDGATIRMHCVLAVTEAAAKSQSYHPRLQQPSAGEAFYATLEGSDVPTSRISAISQSVSVSRTVVEKELGLKTDIVAVFETRTSYPASAVRP